MGAPSRINDFALLDSRGKFHQLSRYQQAKGLVLMSWSDSCDSNNENVETLAQLRKVWQKKGFEFALLNTSGKDRDTLAPFKTDFPLLDDDSQLVAQSLSFTHVGEALLLNPQRLSLYYQGPVGGLEPIFSKVDAEEINDTVRVKVGKIEKNSCKIDYSNTRAASGNVPDYATEVAPIIIERCAVCHRDDGVGPFSMDSHIMLMGWSPMIREVLLNKRMPPTQIDPHIGHSQDANYISATELETLISWIDAGAPRGKSEEDPLKLLQTKPPEWAMGEPDLIIKGPANEVARTGVMDYLYSTVDPGIDTERWIKAIQIRPGDTSVLHHLVMVITAPGEDFYGAEKEKIKVNRRFLGSYAPGGNSLREYPQQTGVRIPPGYRVSMQFHYVTNGKATVDKTEVGLYFYDQPPAKEYQTLAISPRFVLPPNDPEYDLQAEHVFDRDVIITGIRAHMHFRGKHMKFSAQQENGDWEDILSVPAYNYGWQPQYRLSEPVKVPAGRLIRISGAFDNSVSNPNNPDPNKEIAFGLNSWDEMFSGYVSYHFAD